MEISNLMQVKIIRGEKASRSCVIEIHGAYMRCHDNLAVLFPCGVWPFRATYVDQLLSGSPLRPSSCEKIQVLHHVFKSMCCFLTRSLAQQKLRCQDSCPFFLCYRILQMFITDLFITLPSCLFAALVTMFLYFLRTKRSHLLGLFVPTSAHFVSIFATQIIHSTRGKLGQFLNINITICILHHSYWCNCMKMQLKMTCASAWMQNDNWFAAFWYKRTITKYKVWVQLGESTDQHAP